MSRRACSCSPRSPSSSCRCSAGAVTAPRRPRPSDSCKEESSTLSVKMKCDFNFKHVYSGLKLVKPDGSGRLGSGTSACLEDSSKDCIKDYERLSDIGSPIVNLRTVELETVSKPLHNKENQHVQPTLNSSSEIDIEELETNGPYEDSGYSSFSQKSGLVEQEEASLSLEENFNDSPQSCLLQTQSPDQYPNKNLLPALHCAKVVCSTLKKNAKRSLKIDWEKQEEYNVGFIIQNIIGRKMGLEYVDILNELFQRGLRQLLANILTQLSDMDLVNVSKVSKIWKKILEDDNRALQLYNKAVQRVTEKNIKFSSHASTREYVRFRTALASVQKSAAQPPSKNCARGKLSDAADQKGSTYSRHNEFSEVAKTLKKNESLKACIRCNSPAKYDCYLQRAICKREGCGFDYCTRCLCNYHTTKDCLNGKSLKASYKMGPLPGTKKSKTNLRRL
ncbi:F-box only protein 5 [Pteronotus mesoamericanus]|uniref:F-box only protein 5 n=1 Tax=Pteronotus mesoamericanus TaxID=1884717 RepID=UPI0023EC7210|nr:F-box only protein 5 [Pteronotus parnellii mesoamericanus]